jgi:large subunit ribosomal protein L23
MVKLNENEKRQKAQEETAHEKAKDEKKEAKVEKIKVKASLEDLGIIYYPLVTEKAVNMIDAENKITFVVSDKANKQKVKETIEKAYSVKVDKINIVRDRKGRKKAIVRLNKESKAQDLATKLGVL